MVSLRPAVLQVISPWLEDLVYLLFLISFSFPPLFCFSVKFAWSILVSRFKHVLLSLLFWLILPLASVQAPLQVNYLTYNLQDPHLVYLSFCLLCFSSLILLACHLDESRLGLDHQVVQVILEVQTQNLIPFLFLRSFLDLLLSARNRGQDRSSQVDRTCHLLKCLVLLRLA